MQIGELARTLGIRPSAIRYYESEGLLPAPGRVRGRRIYGPEALERLRRVRAAQRVGLTLAEIRGLLPMAPGKPLRRSFEELARKKLRELDALEAEIHVTRALLLASLACGCSGANTCDVVRRVEAAPKRSPPRSR